MPAPSGTGGTQDHELDNVKRSVVLGDAAVCADDKFLREASDHAREAQRMQQVDAAMEHLLRQAIKPAS